MGPSHDKQILRQGSHRSGKSGKIFEGFFQSGKNRGFPAKIREKNFKSGNFFPKPFSNLINPKI